MTAGKLRPGRAVMEALALARTCWQASLVLVAGGMVSPMVQGNLPAAQNVAGLPGLFIAGLVAIAAGESTAAIWAQMAWQRASGQPPSIRQAWCTLRGRWATVLGVSAMLHAPALAMGMFAQVDSLAQNDVAAALPQAGDGAFTAAAAFSAVRALPSAPAPLLALLFGLVVAAVAGVAGVLWLTLPLGLWVPAAARGLRAWAALRRGWQLSRGRRWSLLGTILLSGGPEMAVSGICVAAGAWSPTPSLMQVGLIAAISQLTPIALATAHAQLAGAAGGTDAPPPTSPGPP